jgi:Cytochrome P460
VRRILIAIAVAMSLGASQVDAPQFTRENALIRPANYREWIWLSSGLGMSYAAEPSGEPGFDNVFVAPAAYRAFIATGKWPDKTMFVLEEREAVSKGSINRSGHFQGSLMGLVAEVKDTSRFPGGWAFFALSGSAPSATALPKIAPCYSCHAQHGAVDNTFVQFYPTLFEVAKQKGTLRASY